jgi:hypothetical protein
LQVLVEWERQGEPVSDYPILVERYRGEQSMTIVCEDCHAERVIDADDISNEGDYICPRDTYGQPTVCGGFAVMKYQEADSCPNCGKLGFWDEHPGQCCSRVCQLQAEYAKELAARKASA